MNASRELIPLHVADLSLFAKKLRKLLAESQTASTPTHLALLNLLAKSAGHRNYQALRAAPMRSEAPAVSEVPAKPIVIARGSTLPDSTRKTLGHFDSQGKFVRWPTKYAVQQRALWALWARLPARRALTEREVNQYLLAHHAFGDPATLRRELVNARLLWRTVDGRVYRKEARRPAGEVREFLTTFFQLTCAGP